ncbi:MFS transporter [Nocardia aurantia]|uniref:Antiseptic resistance protein n=1 Tax=Nocardia aurantia TaxID=2585199 RepID=A0A7K0DKG8_9NOCA|nr:MFS transporter [Nocardia aurantia]MQY25712.1 Antiseptic resistance protein [Nocardia aurantia]
MTDQRVLERPATLSAWQRRWTLIVSCLGVGLVMASMAALYTALPQIATATGATQSQLTWMVDGYTLILAALLLPAGALGDRYGRRGMLIAGLTVFSAGSILALTVHEPMWVIVARMISGIGAALVMPSTLSILTGVFPPEHWGRAVGVWAAVAGSGGVIGLVGSGVLLRYWSWPSIFVVLAAVAAVLAVAALAMPGSREPDHPRIDLPGSVTSAAAIGLLVYGLTEAPEYGWRAPQTIALLAGAAVAGAVFVIVELRTTRPLLPVRLFAHRAFSTGVTSLMLQFVVTFGLALILVQYLQLVLGYSPLRSTLAVAPMAGPLLPLAVIAPMLMRWIGLRWMTVTGLATMSAGLFLLLRLHPDTHYSAIVLPLALVGAGIGLCATPATAVIIGTTPTAKHGVAAAVNDAARELGAAIGIAMSGGVLAAGYHHRIQPALPGLPEQIRGPVGDSLAGALAVTAQAGPEGRPLTAAAIDAFMHGIHQSVLALAIVATVGAVVTLASPDTRHVDRLTEEPTDD